MYTIVIETPTLLNRTLLWSSGKVSNRISAKLYHFRKRLGISRSCSDIRSAKSETTTCNQVYNLGSNFAIPNVPIRLRDLAENDDVEFSIRMM